MKNLQIRRGLDKNLPVLLEGEPGFSTDIKRLYIGGANDENIALANKAELDDKVHLDGKTETKIEFVSQGVIKNGLVDIWRTNKKYYDSANLAFKGIINHTSLKNIQAVNVTDSGYVCNVNTVAAFINANYYSDNLTVIINTLENVKLSGGIITIGGTDSSTSPVIEVVTFKNQVKVAFFKKDEPTYIETFNIPTPYKTIIIEVSNGILSIQCDEHKFKVKRSLTNVKKEYRLFRGSYFQGGFNGIVTIVQIYNRLLTPQEITHNFSVLNNPPSIKELYATDTDGKASALKFTSDTDHIIDRAGRTQEQINNIFYKRSCKEFTSTDGSSITIENGEEGHILSAKIKGHTIKNLLPTEFATTKKTITTGFADVFLDLSLFKPNAQYDFVINVSKNTLNKAFHLYNSYNGFFNSSYNLEAGKTGIIRFSKTTVENMVGTRFLMGAIDETRTGEIVIDWVAVVESGSGQFVTSAVPFGLFSTEAIVSNNGNSYPIYEPVIQGKTKILKAPKGTQNWVEIDAEEERDTATYDYKLESINSDLGSALSISDCVDRITRILYKNTVEIELTGEEPFYLAETSELHQKFYMNTKDYTKFNVVCTHFKNLQVQDLNTEFISKINNNTDINILKTKASTVDQFKSYLAQQKANGTPVTIRYQLATPIQTQLTEEQLKAYDAYKKVLSIDKVGSAQNSLEILEDGSGVFTQNVKRVLCTDIASNYSGLILENTNTVGIALSTSDRTTASGNIVSNLFNLVYPYTQDLEGYSSYDTGNSIIIKINKSKLSALTKNAFVKYLADNKVEFIYKLAIPVITYIPKELMPVILTHNKTNTWEVGGAVKASNFKITQPVDRIAEIEARLQALENTTIDVVLNK